MSVQEVTDGHGVHVAISFELCISEHLLEMVALRSDAHVLLAKRPDVVANVDTLLSIALAFKVRRSDERVSYELFRKGNLLELHFVDSGGCGA